MRRVELAEAVVLEPKVATEFAAVGAVPPVVQAARVLSKLSKKSVEKAVETSSAPSGSAGTVRPWLSAMDMTCWAAPESTLALDSVRMLVPEPAVIGIEPTSNLPATQGAGSPRWVRTRSA